MAICSTQYRLAALLFVVVAFLLGCSESATEDHGREPYSQSQATETSTPRATVNPDQAAGLVGRFYRDVNAQNVSDVSKITSSDFLRDHTNDWVPDYGWIQDPKLQVKSVDDRRVSYLLDYTYPTTAGKLYWERTGTWTLNHGSASGWVLDKDTWDSIHLIGMSARPNGAMIPVQDKVYGDGRHEFEFMGERFSFLADNRSWHITPVGPANDAQNQSSATVSVTTNGSTQTYSGSGTTHIYVPPVTSGSCEDASLQWKSEEGDWIGTDDGRKFHVMPGDESEVVTWTVPDELKICGDQIINVDDRSEVEIY